MTTLAYGGDGLLDTVTDPASRVTTFQHDAAGDLTRIIDPDLSERDFAYDARHRLTSQTSKRDFATTYDYGFHGRVLQANWPDGSTRKLAPAEAVGLVDPASGQGTQGNPVPFTRPDAVVATFTDGNDNTVTNTLDGFGASLGSTDALNRTVTAERDSNGLVTRRTAANGRIDDFTYDANGNMLTRTEAVGDPLERVTTFTYEPVFNRVTQVTDPEQNVNSFDYDTSGNLIETIDAALVHTDIVYADANCPGEPTSVTQGVGLPEEAITSVGYDPSTCNTVTTTDPLNNVETFSYDAAGNVISVIDAESRETRSQFDALNRVTKTIDATNSDPDPACGAAGVTCFDYDAEGNLIEVTDANGSVTGFNYDNRERPIERIDPLLLSETFNYDGDGNLQFATDRKNQTIELQYDLANRLTAMIMEPGTANEVTRTFGYDTVDNLTSVADPDSSLTFAHDLLNRTTSTSTTGSPVQPDVSLTYTYDDNGNRLSLVDPVGQTDYVYDELNRLTDLIAPGQVAIPFTYDALHRLTGHTLPNGIDTAVTYDLAGRVTAVNHDFGATPVSSFDYLYDMTDNRTEQTQQRSTVSLASVQNYGYDDLERVTSATHPLPASPAETFTYDPVGNSLLRDGQVTNSTFDAANRLIEDETSCYGYDANGNLETLTVKVAGTCTGSVTTYTHDAEDRLVQIDFPDLTVATYRYDGIGRRIEKDVDGTITRYVYDIEDILLEYDGTNTLVARYTHGPGIDKPLVMQRDLDSSGTFEAIEAFAYHADALGSITEMTDSTGAVAQTLVYDTFGQVVQETGVLANPYAYTGRERDPESGLFFYRARYYSPSLGRFLAEDPIGFSGGDVNLFAYVGNNPVSFIDPLGLARTRSDFGPGRLGNGPFRGGGIENKRALCLFFCGGAAGALVPRCIRIGFVSGATVGSSAVFTGPFGAAGGFGAGLVAGTGCALGGRAACAAACDEFFDEIDPQCPPPPVDRRESF